MAEVANPFNPVYQDKHEETYLNYSRGADAPRPQRQNEAMAESNIVANSINLGLGVVNAKDAHYKERVREEITADVDAIRDPWIGAGPSQTVSGKPGTPADLVKQGERLSKMTAAYQAGKLNDRHYWAQMDNIARTMRARYPGYREHIDNVISGITGGTPANVLQRSIADEAAKMDGRRTAAEKEDADLRNYASKQGIWKPYFEDLSGAGLREAINTETSFDARLSREKSVVENMNSKDARAAKYADRVAGEEIQGVIYDTMFPAIKKFDEVKNAALSSGKPLSPEQVTELGQSGAALAESLVAQTSAVLSQPAYAAMSPQDKAARIDLARKQADLLTSALQSGSWDAVSSISNSLKMTKDSLAIGMVSSDALIGQAITIKEQMGEVFLNAHLSHMNPRTGNLNMSDIGTALSTHYANKSVLKEEGSLTADFDSISNAEVDDPAAVRKALYTNNLSNLTNPETPAVVKARMASRFFGQENKDFLSYFPERRLQIFRELSSPAVAKSMAEVRDSGRSDLYDAYKNWREYTAVKVLFKTDFDTARSIPGNDRTMFLGVDQSTGKLVAQPRQPNPNEVNAAWDSAASWINNSKTTIDNINSVIDSLTPGWKAEGLNPAEEAQKLYQLASVDFGTPKADSLLTSIQKAIGTVPSATQQLGDSSSLDEVMNYLRDKGYTPGERQSTNVEDRRGQNSIIDDALYWYVNNRMFNLEGNAVDNSDVTDPNRTGDFAAPGLAGADAAQFTKEQVDSVAGTSKELRELYRLLSTTEDPEARQMIREDINSIRQGGVNPMFRVGQKLGIYQNEMASKNPRGADDDDLPFSQGSASLRNNPSDTLAGEQGIQDIVSFLQDKEYVPGERISDNVIDATIKNEAQAKQVIDEWFRLRDQAVTLARLPGGDPRQTALIRQDAKMYNRIVGDLIRKWPGTYPEVYEMIKRLDAGEEKIRKENSVDGAIEGRMNLGVPAKPMSAAEKDSTAARSTELLTKAIDAVTGIPSAIEDFKEGDAAGLAVGAALSFIPGTRLFKGQLEPYIKKGLKYAVVDRETGSTAVALTTLKGARNAMKTRNNKIKADKYYVEDLQKLYKEAPEHEPGMSAVVDAEVYRKYFNDILHYTMKNWDKIND